MEKLPAPRALSNVPESKNIADSSNFEPDESEKASFTAQNCGKHACGSFHTWNSCKSAGRRHVMSPAREKDVIEEFPHCKLYRLNYCFFFECFPDSLCAQWCPKLSSPGSCFLSPSIFVWPPSCSSFWDAHCTFALLISVNLFEKHIER